MSDTLPVCLVTLLHEDESTSLVSILDLPLDSTHEDIAAIVGTLLDADDTVLGGQVEAFTVEGVTLPPITRPYEQGQLDL